MIDNKAIFYIEDNPADYFLFAEHMRRMNFLQKIHWISSGEKALQLLKRNAVTPALIILDLNLPGISGHSVLRFLKTDVIKLSIPVIIFSSSNYEKDIAESYQNHANSYIVKPGNLKDFLIVAGMIKDYWFRIVDLPKRA